jgi:outer membrane protein TolC
MRRMRRWRWLGAGLLTLGAVAGCTQHHFMTEGDYKHYNGQALAGITGSQCDDPADMPRMPLQGQIRTVLSPEAQPREISLAECLAIALERGRTGEAIPNTTQSVFGQTTPRGGQAVGPFSDAIRVFAYDPALQAVDIEQALSKFDAFYRGGMTWNKVDRQIGNALDSFQGAFAQINAIAQETASFQNSLLKPLPTGGLAGVSFNTDYEFSNLNSRVNPSYRPVLSLSVEQPLFKGAGVAINELLDAHPGSIRTQVPVGGRVPGILLSRINTEEAQLDFERRVMQLCYNVEDAYWRVYAAYWAKYAAEIALRQTLESWNIANAKYKAGSATLLEVRTVETQYRSFEVAFVQAMGAILEAERRLRYTVGLPPEDGTRLLPLDTPTNAPFMPDWNLAVNDALGNRPDMRLLRLEIVRNQFDVLRTENALLPDVRSFANYDIQGLGSRLDGDSGNSALKSLTRNDFQNWTVGVLATIPLGFRSEHSDVQRAKLQLAQRVHFLQDREESVAFNLQQVIRQLVQSHREIELQTARRVAAVDRVKLQYQAYKAGKETINFLLDAQRDLADALRFEHQAISDYNVQLANLEQQKGTILGYDNVKIAEGPLPDCVSTRASEHLRQRMGALIVHETGTSPLFEQTGGFVNPHLPGNGPVSIAEMQQAAKSLPVLPDDVKQLPAPTPAQPTPEPNPPKQ